MISGGLILWNAVAICEMSQTSWQTGKLRMNEDLVNHSKDLFFHLVHWWKNSQTPRETKARIHQFGKKVLPGIFLGYALIARVNLERRHSGCWYWRIRKAGCIRNLSQKTECKESPDTPKRRIICISCCRWFSNIIRWRLRIPGTHSETGIHKKERESRRRISRR